MAVRFVRSIGRQPAPGTTMPVAPGPTPAPSPVRYYANNSGISGVSRYRVGPTWIEVTFKSGSARTYMYTYASASPARVETMKRLAVAGWGLNRYINHLVGRDYASKH